MSTSGRLFNARNLAELISAAISPMTIPPAAASAGQNCSTDVQAAVSRLKQKLTHAKGLKRRVASAIVRTTRNCYLLNLN